MDRSVRVWDVATGKLLRTMWGHRSWVRSVDVSADGKFAASTGNGLMVIVWNLKTWQREQYFIAHQASATWVEFVGKTNRIVTSGYDHVARYWNLNLRTERLVRVLKGHTKPVNLVCTTPDNKFAITSSQDYTARMWHLDTGKEVHRFGDESSHRAIAISPDGRILASSDDAGVIHLYGVPKITVEDDGTIRRGANSR
jgi:WD40 repeat protein